MDSSKLKISFEKCEIYLMNNFVRLVTPRMSPYGM